MSDLDYGDEPNPLDDIDDEADEIAAEFPELISDPADESAEEAAMHIEDPNRF